MNSKIPYKQLILVEASDYTTNQAVVRMFEYGPSNTAWKRVGQFCAVIGKNGITEHKVEGDMKTPMGLFRLGTAFGTLPAPSASVWPYRLTSQKDFWVDDPDSEDYNQWVRYEGDPLERWKSFERLAIAPYAHAAVIQYNTDPVVRGKGSAIFLHIWDHPHSYTAGCVAAETSQIERLIRWMLPDNNPHIAIGTSRELEQIIPFYN
jgi:L,D-peptidoglycan transpeptidase YkuD (ErfK/YbiS/YcfS/YnhG family)